MKILGAIDIGTNSIRLAIVRIDRTSHDYQTIALHKEVVRLGEGEFAHSRITRPAMERGLLVLRKFVDIARNQGAEEIVVVATAALREAQNRSEFVERALAEAGVEVKVVSGMEEARLIYLGVAQGVDLGSDTGLFVDIGGGTTELIIGDTRDYSFLESLKFGAIRMVEMFPAGAKGTVSKRLYGRMIDYIHNDGANTFRKIRNQKFDIAYGSSGTIMNLAEITARRKEGGVNSIRNYTLKYSDLAETIQMLCGMSVEERRNVPGINPERADIIIGGAAVLDAVMTATGLDSIKISDRALRDGIIIDHLFQTEHVKEAYLSTTPRQRSVMQLCRACRFEEDHAKKVTELAVSIFSQLGDLGLHSYGFHEAELLSCASMAHDVGTFISHTDHHKHSYYILRNWSLLGFDDQEIEIIATTALCHRKLSPRKAVSLSTGVATRRLVEVLTSILRIADALDRSQLGHVQEVVCRFKASEKRMTMEIYANEDCPLEMWSLELKKALMEQVLDVDLSVKRIVAPSVGK